MKVDLKAISHVRITHGECLLYSYHMVQDKKKYISQQSTSGSVMHTETIQMFLSKYFIRFLSVLLETINCVIVLSDVFSHRNLRNGYKTMSLALDLNMV